MTYSLCIVTTSLLEELNHFFLQTSYTNQQYVLLVSTPIGQEVHFDVYLECLQKKSWVA